MHFLAPKPRFDLGRWLARLLCTVFGLIGAIPLAAGLIVRSEVVQTWAATETARVANQLLGIRASYRTEVRLWPIEIALANVIVQSTLPERPAVTVARMAVRPRLFPLLAGKLDVGDILIEQPRFDLVVSQGKIRNVDYKLPETKRTPSARSTRAPFTSIAVTDAQLRANIDGTQIDSGFLDFDVYAEPGPAFEVSLTLGASQVRQRLVKPLWADEIGPPAPPGSYEDVLCQLQGRVRVTPAGLLIRRFDVLGAADFDGAADTQPSCGTTAHEQPDRVALRLSQLWLVPDEGKVPHIDGRVFVRVPSEVTNRYLPMTFSGWVGFNGNVRYSGNAKLPEVNGRFRSGALKLEKHLLVQHSDGDVRIAGDQIDAKRIAAGYADGAVTLHDLHVEPFSAGVPMVVARVENKNLSFSSLIRDVGVTDNTIVRWDLDLSTVSDFRGTLAPLSLTGDLYAETSDFEVYNRSVHDPLKKHMIGVHNATVRGRFAVRPDSVQFLDTRSSFGNSQLTASVKIGFDNWIALEVGEESVLDLQDISPLIDIPMKGKSNIAVTMNGQMRDPLLTGTLAVSDLEFGGFPIGNIKRSKIEFRPLKVKISEAEGEKNKSRFTVPTAELNFDTDASVLAQAKIKSAQLDIRDFFQIWHFDQDPRWDQIHGTASTEALVRYTLGGKGDPCGDGNLEISGSLGFTGLDLFEEYYDTAQAQFRFNWLDIQAGSLGFQLDLPNLVLSKGTGRILGSARVDFGGKLQASAVASAVPLAKLQALGSMRGLVRGEANGVAQITGTIDAMKAQANVQVTPVKLGQTTLAGSTLAIELVPMESTSKPIGKSGCGRPTFEAFDRKQYEADASQGVFHVRGAMFGDAVHFEDLKITRQRNKHISGAVDFNRFDVGALASTTVGLDAGKSRVAGALTGRLELRDLPTATPGMASGRATISSLLASYGGIRMQLDQPTEFLFGSGQLQVPRTPFTIRTPSLKGTSLEIQGSLTQLGSTPQAHMSVALAPTPLAAFAELLPDVEYAQGHVQGQLHLTGPLAQLGYDGGFELQNGALELRGSPLGITNLQLKLGLSTGQLRLERATMNVGGGSVAVRGSAPLRGLDLGDATGVLTVRNVGLAPIDGVRLNVDADLDVQRKATSSDGKTHLPRITGEIRLGSFQYSRPVTMSADISALAQRGRQTQFEAYDPEGDLFAFEVAVRSQKNLRIDNNLIDASLRLDSSALTLSGTNQRFGARGRLRVEPGGHIRMRRNTFEVREGSVEFDDPARIAPRVDVTAVTEYRRYNSFSATDTSTTSTSAGAGGSATSGQWLITLHAFGDAEKLRIDLSSQPELSQDDIFLLLTLGLTRTELDQAQSARVGESVALEALGTLSGADEAVTSAIPVIDEFHFGSAYSSRTGQTEPTVTIGKRLSERIRALVTSGLTDSREVRSNLEWQLNRKVSVEGSYDNVNDVSSSSLGNLGADIRWRLEFE
jgi:translocation and assembly module TamB